MGLGITESEMLEQLAARDCQPLSAEETAQMLELFRRATGGLTLHTKVPTRVCVAQRPSAWIVEFFAATRAHVAIMQRLPPNSDRRPAIAGGPIPPERFYDPFGEDETGNPIMGREKPAPPNA